MGRGKRRKCERHIDVKRFPLFLAIQGEERKRNKSGKVASLDLYCAGKRNDDRLCHFAKKSGSGRQKT